MQQAIACIALLMVSGFVNAASFQPLGFFFGGPPSSGSTARGVSADGAVVVGSAHPPTTASGFNEAFRWTSSGGMAGLGDLPGGYGDPNNGDFNSHARGVSANGAVVVGTGISMSGIEAFRWTAGGGMVGIGDLPGGDFNSAAFGVSGDGSVVVGRGNSSLGHEAFRWTADGGMVGIGDLPGGGFNSVAFGVSSDGATVVGHSLSALGLEAFRWTSGDGMVGLGALASGEYFESQSFGVSASGTVVVGQSLIDSGDYQAFIWTSEGGMQSLLDVLVARGAMGMTGWSLYSAEAISADGLWIVGYGQNPSGNTEAFIANIAAPVPIPAAAWLFAGALVALGWLKRLRRHLRLLALDQ